MHSNDQRRVSYISATVTLKVIINCSNCNCILVFQNHHIYMLNEDTRYLSRYAHGFILLPFCRIIILVVSIRHSTILSRDDLLAWMEQWCDCPGAAQVTLKDMGKFDRYLTTAVYKKARCGHILVCTAPCVEIKANTTTACVQELVNYHISRVGINIFLNVLTMAITLYESHNSLFSAPAPHRARIDRLTKRRRITFSAD